METHDEQYRVKADETNYFLPIRCVTRAGYLPGGVIGKEVCADVCGVRVEQSGEDPESEDTKGGRSQ